jgi:hypothetical protein
MASDSNRTDALLFTLGRNPGRNPMRRNAIPQMTTQMMTPNAESRVNAFRVDSLLTSYIETQFLLIESSLNNLKKKFSTSAWNGDDREEFKTHMHMYFSVRALIANDDALELKNAARVGRVDSLLKEVFLLLISPRPTVQVERKSAPDVRPQAENARRNLRVADRNPISPKAEEPPQRDAFSSRLSDGLDDPFRKPLDPPRREISNEEMALLLEINTTLEKRNDAAALASGGRSTTKKAPNPYIL